MLALELQSSSHWQLFSMQAIIWNEKLQAIIWNEKTATSMSMSDQ